MTLNANKPTDQVAVSEIALYARETRAYINALEASIPPGSYIAITDLIVEAGATHLTIGTQLSKSMIEVVFVSGEGIATIEYIYGGLNGQTKIFIFNNSVVSFKDGTKDNGKIYLNQLPIYTNFNAQENDVLVLTNLDGNGSTIFGWWKEIFRQVAVK
jgi:hypothetical protein